MGSGNDSILDMYLYETNTLLEQLDGILLAAEQADTFSEDSVNEIFRIMHTIKGSSAMMEFSSLMTVAHRIEDLFFLVREKSMDIVPEQTRPELFDMLFQAVDFFRGEIEKVENDEPLSQSIDHIVNKINSLIDKIQGNPTAPAVESAPAAESTPAAPEPAAAPGANAVNPDYLFGIHVFFDEGSGRENLRAFMLVNSVKDYSSDFVYTPENVENDPSTSDIIADQGFLLWFRTAEERDDAIHAMQGAGSVREYQPVDAAKPAPAPAPEASTQPAGPAPAPVPGPWKKCSFYTIRRDKEDDKQKPHKVDGYTDGIYNYYAIGKRSKTWHVIHPVYGLSIVWMETRQAAQARALELSDKIRDMASKPDARLQAYADMMKAAQDGGNLSLF